MITAVNIIPALQNFLYGKDTTTPVITVLAVLIIIITLLSIGRFKNPIHTVWWKIIDILGLYSIDYRRITKEFRHGSTNIQTKKLILLTGLSDLKLDFMGVHNRANNTSGEHISWLELHNETIINVHPGTLMNEHEWQQVATLLTFYRPHQPINSLVLTIPYSQLVNGSFENMNLSLEYLTHLKSDHRISMYILITGVDDVLFAELIKNMSIQEKNMPIGWSDDGSFANCKYSNAHSVIDDILLSLMLQFEQLIAAKSIFNSSAKLEGLYKFGELIKPGLRLILMEMFAIRNDYNLRGFYFSAGEEAPLFTTNLFFNKILLEDGNKIITEQNRNLIIFWNIFVIIITLCFMQLFRLNKYFSDQCNLQIGQIELIRHYLAQNQTQDLQIPNKLIDAIGQIKSNTSFSYWSPISWIYPIDSRMDSALSKALNILTIRNNITRFNQALKNMKNGILFKEMPCDLGDIACIAQPEVFASFYNYLEQIRIIENWGTTLNSLQALQNPNDLELIWNETHISDKYKIYPTIYREALAVPLPSIPLIKTDQFQEQATIKLGLFAESLSKLGNLGDLMSQISDSFKSMQLSSYRDEDFLNLKNMLCNLVDLSNKNKFDYVLEDGLLTSPKFLELVQIGKTIFGDVFAQQIIEQTKSGLHKARTNLLNNNATLLAQTKDDIVVKPQVNQIIKLISYITADPEIVDPNRSNIKIDTLKITQNPCLWDKNILSNCEKKLIKLLNLEKSDMLECLDPDCKPYFINCLTQICSEIIETAIVMSCNVQSQNSRIADNFIDCMPTFLSIVNFAKLKRLPIENTLIQILQAQALNIFTAMYQKPINQQVNGDSFIDPWPQWKEINTFIGKISSDPSPQIEGVLKSIFDPSADFDSIAKNITYLVSSRDTSFNGAIKNQIWQILQDSLRSKYMVRLLNIYPALVEKISSLNKQGPFSKAAPNFVEPSELADFNTFYNNNQNIFSKINSNFKNESWYPFIQNVINLGEWTNAIYGATVRSGIQISFKDQGIANNIDSAQLTMNGSNFKPNNSSISIDLNNQSAQFSQINFNKIAIQVTVADASSFTFANQSKTYTLSYSGNFAFVNLIMNNFNKLNPDGSIELAIPLNLSTSISTQTTVLNLFVTIRLQNLTWPAFEAYTIPQLV